MRRIRFSEPDDAAVVAVLAPELHDCVPLGLAAVPDLELDADCLILAEPVGRGHAHAAASVLPILPHVQVAMCTWLFLFIAVDRPLCSSASRNSRRFAVSARNSATAAAGVVAAAELPTSHSRRSCCPVASAQVYAGSRRRLTFSSAWASPIAWYSAGSRACGRRGRRAGLGGAEWV